MNKFIPYEKLSKKEKRKRDSKKRNTWGSFSPVTRKPENSRAYNRSEMKRQRLDDMQFAPHTSPIMEDTEFIFRRDLKWKLD